MTLHTLPANHRVADLHPSLNQPAPIFLPHEKRDVPLAKVGDWLRLAKLGSAFALRASDDGRSWRLVRYFALKAQSPTGPGCTVTFDEIAYTAGRLGDLRDGS